jgi:hypothetical protein
MLSVSILSYFPFLILSNLKKNTGKLIRLNGGGAGHSLIFGNSFKRYE